MSDPNADLLSACFQGDFDFARAALEAGADLNADGDPEDVRYRNKTPLTLACAHGHVDLARFLVEAGADLEGKRELHTPLLHSARHPELRKLLVEAGAKITPLVVFVSGDLEPARSLLEREPEAARLRDEEGYSGLHLAVALTDPAMARLLVEAGAPLDPVSSTGLVPLHCALVGSEVTPGQIELVELLLQAGADPRVKTPSGRSPLDMARSTESPELIRLLEDAVASD